MHYYLKIIAKNDAAWLQAFIQEPGASKRTEAIMPLNEPGFNGVPSQMYPSPWYGELILANKTGINHVNFQMLQWRDVEGYPGPRSYIWEVRFQLVVTPERGKFGNDLEPVSHEIHEKALWYGDRMNLTLQVQPGLSALEQMETNTFEYNQWKKRTGRI